MDWNGVDQETMQEWDAHIGSATRVYSQSTAFPTGRGNGNTPGGSAGRLQVSCRNTAPHHWKYEEPNSDGEFDDPDVEVVPAKIVCGLPLAHGATLATQ